MCVYNNILKCYVIEKFSTLKLKQFLQQFVVPLFKKYSLYLALFYYLTNNNKFLVKKKYEKKIKRNFYLHSGKKYVFLMYIFIST